MTLGRVGCAILPGRAPEWTFVVGRGFIAAVPATTRQWIIASLTDLVAHPAVEMESVVSLVPLSGEDAVASFVVAVPGGVPGAGPGADGVPVSAVIRGAAAADVFSIGGSRRFTDRGVRPWLLADFQAVTGVVIGSQHVTMVSADLLESGTPIGIGAVPGQALFWSTGAASPDGFDDAIQLPPRSAGFPHADDDTVLRAPRPAEETVLLHRRKKEPFTMPVTIEAAVPATAPAAVPAAVLPRYGFRVGGLEWRLDTVYFVGRRPTTPRGFDNRVPRLVTVRSATSAVSGTHLEVRQEGDSVVVTDLGSTNGTTVVSPNGKKERMRRGASLAVIPGTRVDIGDGNIIEILPVSGY
jgi:hypothetical protein